MALTIQTPTPCRVVEYRNNEGRLFAGVVDRHFGNGTINLNYFDDGNTRWATSVSHDGDGGRNSWRYPPRDESKTEVAR